MELQQAVTLPDLPPAINALVSGTISWMHARIIADETVGLDRSGAVALAAHFFSPDAPSRCFATPG